MEQVFGAVTPFMVVLVVTLLTQWIKNSFPLTDRQVQLVALGLSILLIGVYQILILVYQMHIPLDPLQVFIALIFGFMGWFTAIGMYEVGSKQLVK